MLADTFQISEDGDTLDAGRVRRQQRAHPRQLADPDQRDRRQPAVLGRADSANDLNANIKYPTLDGGSKTPTPSGQRRTNKKQPLRLLHPRVPWATDRIGDAGSSRSSPTAAGSTATPPTASVTLADEYSRIYVYNLRGNQRTAGNCQRKEGGKIFGGGSRNTVAIFIGVKDPQHAESLPDPLSRHRRLPQPRRKAPDHRRQRDLDTRRLADDHAESRRRLGRSARHHVQHLATDRGEGGSVRRSYGFRDVLARLGTNRDAWVYNFSRTQVGRKRPAAH